MLFYGFLTNQKLCHGHWTNQKLVWSTEKRNETLFRCFLTNQKFCFTVYIKIKIKKNLINQEFLFLLRSCDKLKVTSLTNKMFPFFCGSVVFQYQVLVLDAHLAIEIHWMSWAISQVYSACYWTHWRVLWRPNLCKHKGRNYLVAETNEKCTSGQKSLRISDSR